MLSSQGTFNPPCLAFKVESEAIKTTTGLSNFFEKAITRVTGGKYCHVEIWLGGPISMATCHAAREPKGTSIEIVNLSSPLFDIVQLPPTNNDKAFGWSLGDCGRRYGILTIGGIALELANLTHLDSNDRICSEDAFLFCRDIIGLQFPKEVIPGMVAPDGHPKGGWGLYELVQGALGNGSSNSGA